MGQADSRGGAGSWHMVAAAMIAATVAALLWVVLAGPALADDDDDDGGEFVPRQVVANIRAGASIGAIEREYRLSMIERLPGGGKIYLFRTREGVNPANLADRMEQDQRVVYAEPNFEAGLPEGSRFHKARPGGEPDPTNSDATKYHAQYAAENLNLAGAHAVNRGGGTVVAVIDTGAQAGHPDLSGRLTSGRDFVEGDNPADKGNGRDDDRDGVADEMVGHGTHVAGIVALAAPGAKIMPLRALDSDGRGTTFGVAQAIRYAIRNGADVVNLSLGTSRETELLEDLIEGDDDDDGGSGNVVFAAAAGNDGDTGQQYPAAEEGAIAVTSVGEDGSRSSFANYGPWITVAAPGDGIHGPFPVNGYATWSGTSMATPFVAAQAALIRGARPSMGPECVVGIIRQTARPLSTNLGAGHADLEASTSRAATANPCSGTEDD